MAITVMKLEVFGRLRLMVNGKETPLSGHGFRRPWRLFFLLACQKDKYLPEAQLIDRLWPANKVRDGKNSLKNEALRLRKELKSLAVFGGSPVVGTGAGYYLSDEIEVTLDYHQFLVVCDELRRSGTKRAAERLPIFYALVDVYKSGFVHHGDSPWLEELAVETEEQFRMFMAECCEMLLRDEMHQELLALYDKVSIHSNVMVMYRNRAMAALGTQRGARKAFRPWQVLTLTGN